MVKEVTAAYDKKRKVVFSDGSVGLSGDFPIAVVSEKSRKNEIGRLQGLVVDPVFDHNVTKNLYGRIMTLLEATIENPERLKAVKDVFGKELRSWENDVFRSAREIAEGGNSSTNIYSGNNIYKMR